LLTGNPEGKKDLSPEYFNTMAPSGSMYWYLMSVLPAKALPIPYMILSG
jgi:hypothetical protein